MVHKVVGIDPGLDGGLVVVNPAGRLVAAIRMPTVALKKSDGGTRRLIDVVKIAAFLREHGPILAVIEDVFSSPQMGVVGAFSFGEGKGALRGVCGSLGIEALWVSPLTWKGKLGLLLPRGRGSKAAHKKALKQAAIQMAKRFFPGEDCMGHDGVAEAALLAGYGLLQSSSRSTSVRQDASTQSQGDLSSGPLQTEHVTRARRSRPGTTL